MIILISSFVEMAAFENEEYADIMFCYGFCDGDAVAARTEYARRFPNRRIPNVRVFSGTYRRIRETGSVRRRQIDAGRPRIYAPEDENAILEQVRRDPTVSTSVLARRLGYSQWKVWFTIHTAGLYPFHYTPVHALEEGDAARRIDFCRYLLDMDIENSNYLNKILWTDESKFDRDGITNFHNSHFWSPKNSNPKQIKPRAHQHRFSLNVWMGIIDRHLIGPYFFPQNLNGEIYENFLRNDMELLLEDVPIALRREIIYQHDGCPAHFRRGVREWLDQHYPHRWIGRGGPIPWPARCPDLTPCDFYLWGHMKDLVYKADDNINSVEELKQKILDAAGQIRQNLTTRVIKTELRRRLRTCIRHRGSHFEQDL